MQFDLVALLIAIMTVAVLARPAPTEYSEVTTAATETEAMTETTDGAELVERSLADDDAPYFPLEWVDQLKDIERIDSITFNNGTNTT